MGKDSIDASLGLTFSLTLFQRYRKSGVLQAQVRHIPGIRGEYMAYITLVNGEVGECIIEDRQRNRQPVTLAALRRADDERGPFEWRLYVQPVQTTRLEAVQTSTFPVREEHDAAFLQPIPPRPGGGGLASGDEAIPVLIAAPQWEKLSNWTDQQKRMVYHILTHVDGRRPINEIKSAVALPANIVDEVFQTLVTLQIIRFLP